MEEKQTSMLKQTMTFGAIIALIMVVYSILLYILDLSFNKVLGYLQYVILFIGIFLTTKTYRDKSLGGFISYGKALAFGVLISLFVGIVTIFFGYIMMRYIDPGMIDKYLVIAEERLQNSRFIPEDQIPEALERSRRMMTAPWTIPIGVITFTFFGFIISLITSAFVRKEPNPLT